MQIKHNNFIYDLDNFFNINLYNFENYCELWLDDLYIKKYNNQQEAIEELQKIYMNPDTIYEI